MASPEPTVEECENFRNIGDCMLWAGFHMSDLNEDTSAASLFLKAIGLNRLSLIRTIAAMDSAELVGELESFQIEGARPNLATRTHLRLALSAARIAGGVEKRQACD